MNTANAARAGEPGRGSLSPFTLLCTLLPILLAFIASQWVVSGCSPAPKTTAQIHKMASSDSDVEREQAVYEIARAYKPEYFSNYALLLDDEEISVRHAAMKNVAETHDKRFIEVLEHLLPMMPMEDKKLIQTALDQLKAEK